MCGRWGGNYGLRGRLIAPALSGRREKGPAISRRPTWPLFPLPGRSLFRSPARISARCWLALSWWRESVFQPGDQLGHWSHLRHSHSARGQSRGPVSFVPVGLVRLSPFARPCASLFLPCAPKVAVSPRLHGTEMCVMREVDRGRRLTSVALIPAEAYCALLVSCSVSVTCTQAAPCALPSAFVYLLAPAAAVSG